MVQTPPGSSSATLPLHVPETLRLRVTAQQFSDLAASNQDLHLELSATGELILNPPTGWETGERNSNIAGELYLWWRSQGEPGKIFDSSTAFMLPNNAIRSPDASWVCPQRWNALTPQQKGTFAKVCPDFVLELRSSSDVLQPLQAKMQEYLENGARLGWLINPQQQQVEIYRAGQTVEILAQPNQLSGEEVLQGFVLKLQRIF
ncbi:MAG: Uma2 family endonuclease [Leptolyngbya sp. RL_3_1]|nr:Uma2 family endonuclease [Leptolyngbya sp. RL_3_1]